MSEAPPATPDAASHKRSEDGPTSPDGSESNWKDKYYDAIEMLNETRTELDDFQTASKELEEELTRDLERNEKAMQDQSVKFERVERERDDWKTKFMTLQTTHNTISSSLQRELDTLRQEQQKAKVQLRDLEMGNDDLERNERAVASSLADAEARYARTLEEKIMIEQELFDKANLEEEMQRVRDELRDANLEAQVLKDQITSLKDQLHLSNLRHTASTPASTARSSSFHDDLSPPTDLSGSTENLTKVTPPPDLKLSDLAIAEEASGKSDFDTPKPSRIRSKVDHSNSPSGRPAIPSFAAGASGSKSLDKRMPVSLSNSRASPSSPSRLPSRRFAATPSSIPSPASRIVSGAAAPIPKSRGVQLIGNMRTRMGALEQKLHTRVPRMRNGSVSDRTAQSPSTVALSKSRPARSNSIKTPGINSSVSAARRSAENQRTSTPSSDSTSGWVYVTDGASSPTKGSIESKLGHHRRTSTASPIGPSSFQNRLASATMSPPVTPASQTIQSNTGSISRRPHSRLSLSSISTTSSRPPTPTMLPVASAGLYNGSKSVNETIAKRASLGGGHTMTPSGGTRVFSYSTSGSDGKMPPPSIIPQRPTSSMNNSQIPISRIPSLGGRTSLGGSQSGIPRPSSRQSVDDEEETF